MGVIQATDQKALDTIDPNGTLVVPAMEVPGFRLQVAVNRNVQHKLLLCTGGGIGDYITAEPAFRYAFKTFQNCEFSLLSQAPEFFRHLPFKEVFDERKGEKPEMMDYLVLRSMPEHEGLQCEFLTQLWTHCVDYASLNLFRFQLPNCEKQIYLKPNVDEERIADLINSNTDILIHPGRTWQSRTFPKWWWDKVIKTILEADFHPVLIGSPANAEGDRGTVDVDTTETLDFRGKLDFMSSVAVCQKARVLLTNDSSPLHMAASGNAWIGLVSTARHPDYVTHWRHGIWGYRMQNHSKGGVWETYNVCPNQLTGVNISVCDEEKLISWLPDPVEYAQWAVDKCSRP